MRIAFGLLGAGLLAAAVAWAGSDEERAVSAGATALTAGELKALYLGNTVAGVTPGGYRFETFVEADGTIPSTERRGAGEFSVPEDGRVCMRFEDVWEGRLRCWTYYRVDGEIRMYREDGALSGVLEAGY